MNLDNLKEEWNESKSKLYMSFDTWLEQRIDNQQVRDYLRLEQAAWHMSDVFMHLDNIESDELFESVIYSMHERADELDRMLRDTEQELTEKIGKEIVDAYLSTINQ